MSNSTSYKRDRFDWVVKRLERWGEYHCKRTPGLSLPGIAQEAKIQCGGSTNYRDYSPLVHFAHKEHETDRAVARLPDDWQFIVKRKHIDGKKHAQIGEQIGRSESWVRQNYDQILAFLASAIPQEKISA